MTDARHQRDLSDTPSLAGSGTGASGDSGNAGGSGGGSSGATPGKTAPILTPEQQADAAVQQMSKGGTNMDTLVGRLAVDQGLVTQDEVQHAMALARTQPPDSQRSLVQILLDESYVTRRQMARLKEVLESERSGQKIPGYKILGKLGAGAMATVYKAKQLSLDRLVAIKVLPHKFSNNPQFIERFYAEGRAAAQLNHPNIVQAYDVGKSGEFHYFVMEYVEGRTVFDDITKHKRYNEAEAIDIIIQIAEALMHAHQRGLIHRDVKPKNIMINKDGVAKLADMGLARAMSDKEAAEAEAGKAFGTPYYISPEQIRGEVNVGPPADIYSLGATLYHMLTGNVPFEGKNPSAVMHKHLKAELVPPDHVNPKLSAGVSELVEMMMAKKAGERYQTCQDLLIDLRAIRAGKVPPMAHKEVAADLSSLARAESAAPAQMAIALEPASSGPVVRPWLFITMVVVLVTSLTVNFVLALRHLL